MGSTMNGLIFGLNTNYMEQSDTLFYGRSNGVHRVATLFRTLNHNVEVVDFFNFWSDSELQDYITKFMEKHKSIDFVGIGYTFSDYDIVRLNKILLMIRSLNPGCNFFAGGYGIFHGTTTFHLNGEDDIITLYIKGFADGAIEDLEHFAKTGRFNPFNVKIIQNVNGIGKKVVECNTHYKNFDLSRLRNIYTESDGLTKEEPIVLETCRGCIFKCKFCSFELIGKKKSDNYIREKEDIKNEIIDNYTKWGTYKYIIADDTFNDNPIKTDMIYEISQEVDFDLEFWAFLRADLLYSRPDELEKMIKSGLKSAIVGIETLHLQAGRAIGKGFNGEKLKEFLISMKQKHPDIKLTGTFIIGLPHESKETFLENIKWAFDSNIFENVSINQLMIPLRGIANNHPHSEFTDNWAQYGYRHMSDEMVEEFERETSSKLTGRFKWEYDKNQYMLWENDHMNIFEAVDLMNNILRTFGHLNKCDSTLMCFSNNFDRPTSYQKNTYNGRYQALKSLVNKYIQTKMDNI